jgi:mono/diheme cytochrome c family protein
MGKFVFGVVVGVAGIVAGTYVYPHYGYMDMRADRPAGRIEQMYLNNAMDRYAERRAPGARNPFRPTEPILVDGIRLYRANCAFCHGGAEKPVADMRFSPPAPQFLKDAPDMPENQNFLIIRDGIRMTGMPAWGKAMSDEEIWKLVTFLSAMEHIDTLPPAAQAAWKSK